MSAPAFLRPAALSASFVALAMLASCSSNKDSTAPIVQPGPSFNFTFSGGTSIERTFTEVGTWNYRCTPHNSQGMQGTVTVSAMSTNDSALVQVGPGGLLVFDPASVTIKAGGKVRWVAGSPGHTVTR